MATVNIFGDIVPDDYGEIYEWFGYDYTTPKGVRDIIDAAEDGEPIDVYINSPGGYVDAGQEIYSLLRSNANTRIHVVGQACSAASIIAMAGHSDISPVGVLMIHNVSGGAQGDYHTMAKEADTLKRFNDALASAYVEKTGIEKDEILKMMDRETWLTANQCIVNGFIDEISEPASEQAAVAASGGIRLTAEDIQQYKAHKAEEAAEQKLKEEAEEITKDLYMYGI